MSGKGYTMMEKLEMGDGKRIAHVMCLFSGLWVVLCVNAGLALYSMHGDVECSTFSLQSASSALTMMTSLFILPAPTLSSLPLPHPSSLSLLFPFTPSCHFCPSCTYLFIDHRCCCGYYKSPLQPVAWR